VTSADYAAHVLLGSRLNWGRESLFGEPPQETPPDPVSDLVNAQKHTVREVHARLKIRPFHSLRLQWAIAANMSHTAESRNHDHKERP